jgi:uncharacterized protein involved in outer membrane biogenesis
MKILKKIALIFVILIVLLIGTAIAVPIIFKDDIVQLVKDTANESVDAQIDFGDFDLGLISSFPKFSFSIQDVSVINKAPFEGDTLAFIGELNFQLDLMSVINGKYSIESFEINHLNANAIVLEDGRANWDIVPEDSTAEEIAEDTTASEPFEFALESYALNDINVKYIDKESDMKAVIQKLNHSGSFKMDGDLMDVFTQTKIEKLDFFMEGDHLVNQMPITAKADLALDMLNSKYTFLENEFLFNELKLGVNGWVAMPEEDIDMDIKVTALDNTFKSILSLIPAAYKSDLEGIETSGDFDLTAILKGTMTETTYPTMDIDLSVKDGFFHYPELPESAKNIQVELMVDNKDGILDHTEVNLKLFHVELAKNPIDIQFYTTNIETDPFLKGKIQSKLNLENLKDVVPMEEGEDYKGRINADLSFNGKMSSIENERYEEFKANGEVSLLELVYETPDMPKTEIGAAYFKFTPQQFELTRFEAKVGNSDIQANGKIDNILSYVFKDETIHGVFNVSSKFFDANEWMEEEEEVSEETQDEMEEEDELAIIPKNINFELVTKFDSIAYDNMPITDFKGRLTVNEGAVRFHDNSMKMLNGTIGIDGVYSTADPEKPFSNLSLDIKQLDIPTAVKAFNTIEQMAPVLKYAEGNMDLTLDFKTLLTDSMTPVYSSMNGKGNLKTKSLMIKENPAMNALAKQVKNDKFQKMRAEDLNISFVIEDGKLNTKPFKLKVGKTESMVSGWNDFDGNMRYVMDTKMPRSEMGSDANQLIDNLAGKASGLGVKVEVGEFLLFDVIAEGTTSDPKYKVVPKGMSGESSLKDQAKEAVKEKVDEVKKKAEDELNKQKEAAQQKIDEEKEKAKAEAEKAKAEAEAKAKAAADKAKAEAEAKRKAEEEKLKKEAAEKAKKLLKGF